MPSRRGCLVVVPLVGGVILLLIAIALIIFLGLRNAFNQEEANPGIPLEVVKLTPTVAPTIQVSPLPVPSCETIIGSDDVQVSVSMPVSLTLGGGAIPILPIVLDAEGWTYPADYAGAATWACGTVVNYVLGMEPTPENEARLTALRPGDEIQVHLSNGATLLFRFAERREVEPHQTQVFDQMRPRLTLIMEQDGGPWQVATADYVSETEPGQPPVETLVQPGQPVRVGDIQLTVFNGHTEQGDGLPAGTMYYLVEFSVENVGTSPLDTAAFSMQLQDNVGSVYLLSPEASATGEHGPLGDSLPPGETAQGSAGYLVPETLPGPTLVWTFTPQPGSESRVSVSIPYEETVPEPTTAGKAEVTLNEDGTFLDSDGDVLIIAGEVRNVGGESLTVNLADLSLTSSAGMSALRSAAPPLPWTLEPGQAQLFELQYETPEASTVLLSLLGYSFEIRGL